MFVHLLILTVILLPITHTIINPGTPAGSQFQEFIGIARYQPAPKWYLEGKLFLETRH